MKKGESLKILWIARTCPYPTNDGEKLRVFNLLKALATWHELTVVFRVTEQEELAGVAELRKFCKEVHGVFVPRPRGALDRIRWVFPFLFSRYPISLCTVYFRPIADVLAAMCATQRFDIVQVEHSSLSIYLDRLRFQGRPATVLTMHNIDHIRNARILENTPFGIAKLYHYLNQARFKQWELDVLDRYDEIIAMSDLDKRLLLEENPRLSAHVVPNGVDIRGIPFRPVDEPTDNIIFVASMDSDANHDGAMYFLREVWPLVRRSRPQLKVAFVGRNPRPELTAADNGDDIVVTGKVDDVFCYYQNAAVAIVPLRSGGGTRLKILEAMAAGTTVVSTSVGCEGLDVDAGVNILIADTPERFAASIAKVLADNVFRKQLIRNARDLVETSYNWELIGQQHDKVYRRAIEHARN